MNKRFETLGEKLEQIANAVGVKQAEKAGDDDEDRKRIKERLKEALDLDKRQQGLEKKDFMEYFFGICKADGRVGKTGSRQHPMNLPPIPARTSPIAPWAL